MYDLFGLGNAIVDTEINIEDSFLAGNRIAKGHMTLIETDRMLHLVGQLDGLPVNRCSGGSAANTAYAVSAFGHATAYTCKVANDAAGRFFIKDMTDAGIDLNVNAMNENGQSGQCLVLITPDAERTMNTDLGISQELGTGELDLTRLRQARYFYVEGYLSSSPPSTAAAIACREAASEAGVVSAVSLSDPSMVEFFRDPLLEILGNGVEVLFCNEEESLNWARTDRLDVAIAELKDIAQEVYLTLGARGSMAITPHGRKEVAGYPVKPVDTTGAGDIYAGACLAARCSGAAPAEAARFANYSASALVGRYGAKYGTPADYRKLRARYV